MSPDDSAALDRQLAQLVRRSRRVLWGVIALGGLVLVGAIAYLTVQLRATEVQLQAAEAQLRADEARLAASCHAWADIGGAPIVVGPDGKASLLGTRIISDARQAWHGQACPGGLPPPQPSFLKWAKYYGLPYN